MNPFRICPVWLCMLVVLSLATSALGTTSATLTGRITDPVGAEIPGAIVRITDVDTNIISTAQSNEAGLYVIPDLPPGRYRVIIQKQGFETIIKPDVVLHVSDVIALNFSMQLGSLAQSVTVQAGAPLVQTQTTQLGNVIESQTMSSLPLNGRSYTDLLSLQAGVTPITSSIANSERAASGGLNEGLFSVNGSREVANSFLVNGGDVEESRTNGTTTVPTLDSIQEFRLLTNTFDAEYGKFSGAIVNVVTKSGANEFHGNVFEFLRNDKLDARSFFDLNQTNPSTGQELPGTARGVFKRNQFGGTLGGRILRNQLFFFGDYQGTRERRGLSTGETVVPSPSERLGDFSDVGMRGLPSLTGTVRGDNAKGDFAQMLSQRLGYTVTAGEPYWVSGWNTMAQAQAGMCVFPGQVISPSAFSPAAKGTLQFIPPPTAFPNGTPIWSSSGQVRRLRDDKFGQRVDLNSARTGSWSFYYHFDDSTVLDPFPSANVPGFAGLTPQRAQQANIHNTHSFGADAVNELMLN